MQRTEALDVDVQYSKEVQNGCETDEVTEIVHCLCDMTVNEGYKLSFKAGDKVKVLEKTNHDWWWAEKDEQQGYIPVNCVSKNPPTTVDVWQNEEYFQNYGTLKLHQEMLKDSARTVAYMKAFEKNSKDINGKIVLDVGCGTGVLSMFAVTYGQAKKVYAVEASSIAKEAEMLIEQNKMSDSIQVINENIENISLPQKIDIIVSEWMGTLLIFEYMIESVLYARDHFLLENGTMMPSSAKLWLVPCSAGEVFQEKISFWGNMYGLDFSVLRNQAINEFFSRPIFNHEAKTEDLLAEEQVLLDINMATVAISDLEVIKQSFDFKVIQTGIFHGFCSWFSTDFTFPSSEENSVTLDTGPKAELTHWKQDLFMMNKPIEVKQDDIIKGSVTLTRNKTWRRHLRVQFDCEIVNTKAKSSQICCKEFLLWR